ncbi:hypothetical protein GCM10009549_26860 [Streptomyces thermoalcalitolerans]|uniref:Uncharacterized protein n=1 Tax=Streptomyces thermoalcalitolerans TaxID=65605 RepID=A0ABN1NPD3_9ACTN
MSSFPYPTTLGGAGEISGTSETGKVKETDEIDGTDETGETTVHAVTPDIGFPCPRGSPGSRPRGAPAEPGKGLDHRGSSVHRGAWRSSPVDGPSTGI